MSKEEDFAELSSPAEVLRMRILPRLDITQEKLADALGVSRLTVSQLLHGRRGVSPEMALRLGRVFGTSPMLWLNLQQKVELEAAARKLGDSLGSLPVLRPPKDTAEILALAGTRPLRALHGEQDSD